MPKKKIFIFKTGSTFPHIKEKWGDFDDFVLRESKLNKDQVKIIDNFESAISFETNKVAGVIITGSHDNVTDDKNWMKNLSDLIRQIYMTNIPMLGICFGHQILAYTFGGKVDYNSKGIETGTISINLNKCVNKDKLLKNFPNVFKGHVSHKQTITLLPENATVLGSSKIESSQIVCFKHDQIWGVQFHPEFNAEITKLYTEAQKDNISKDGEDFDTIYNSITDNNFGNRLFDNFLELCM